MSDKKELKYRIEALEAEIEDLEESLRDEHQKLWEVIQENDRLTLTYEPYRPPGDEHENLDFYGLLEENDSLTENVLDKIEVIKELEDQMRQLTQENRRVYAELSDLKRAMVEMKPKRYPKSGVISFDFWPPRDWFRLSYHSWKPGMAAQLCIGPIRIDWFAS